MVHITIITVMGYIKNYYDFSIKFFMKPNGPILFSQWLIKNNYPYLTESKP